MRYLVCVDGSDASDKAFQMAMSLRKPKDEFIIATAITVKEQKTGAEKLLQKYDAQATEKGVKRSFLKNLFFLKKTILVEDYSYGYRRL